MSKAKILIVMGSQNDADVMRDAEDMLAKFDVKYETVIVSAHRDPSKVSALAAEVGSNGTKVIIAGAGYAAHLAGAFAASTILPVIGVPIDSSPLNGIDSLLSTVQMPSGVPVATVSLGKVGAKNAAVLAVEILATSDDNLAKKMKSYKSELAIKGGKRP